MPRLIRIRSAHLHIIKKILNLFFSLWTASKKKFYKQIFDERELVKNAHSGEWSVGLFQFLNELFNNRMFDKVVIDRSAFRSIFPNALASLGEEWVDFRAQEDRHHLQICNGEGLTNGVFWIRLDWVHDFFQLPYLFFENELLIKGYPIGTKCTDVAYII